ncbi:MAG: hypothetical protein QXQ46_09065 [Thermoplasmatales archaeon]
MDQFDHSERYRTKGDIIKTLILARFIKEENILIRSDLLERLNSLYDNDKKIVLRTPDIHLYGKKNKSELGLAKVVVIKSEHMGISLNLRNINDLVKVTEVLICHPIYGEKVKKSIDLAFLKAFSSVFGDGFLGLNTTHYQSSEDLESAIFKKRGKLGMREKICYIMELFRILDTIKEYSIHHISELDYASLTLALTSIESICNDVSFSSNEGKLFGSLILL